MKLFLFALVATNQLAFSFETPSWVREKYQEVYNSEITVESDESKRFHRGRLFKRGGIRVLSLKGDEFEMAFQYGRLLQKEIAEGALPETALLLEKAVRNAIPDIPGGLS